MPRWSPLGPIFVVAAIVALDVSPSTRSPSLLACVALALLFAGGLVSSFYRSLLVAFLLAAPGAVLLASSQTWSTDWLGPTVAVAALVAGPLAADTDQAWARPGAAPVLLAISCVGLFACVPDTEEARILLGAAMIAAVASRVPWFRAFGPGGATAAIGLYLWVAASDARGRPAALVGAIGALGLLALEPVGRRLRGRRRPAVSGFAAFAVLLAAQAVLAACASRVAGLQETTARALVLLAPVLIAAVLVGFLVGRSPASRGSTVAGPRPGRRAPPP